MTVNKDTASPEPVATELVATRPFGIRDKIGYMFGDFGNDFSFILQLMFFMVFYTNVIGIKPAHVGTMFLVARVLDAFTDVGAGRLIDTSIPGKDGRFRPWIKRMAIPVALASALMYVTFIQDWSYGAKLAWMVGTYLLWGSVWYTLINIPYGSMASVLSDKPEDRAALSVFRSTGAQLAFIVIQVALPLMVYVSVDGKSSLDGTRLMTAAFIMSAIAVVWYFLCYANTQERIVAPPKPADEKMGFGAMMASIATNRALPGLIVTAWLLLIGNLMATTLTPYLWLDYFNAGTLQSVAGFAGLVPPLALVFIAPWLAKRFGKKEVAIAATLICGGINIALYFMNLQNAPTTFIVIWAVAQFALATSTS